MLSSIIVTRQICPLFFCNIKRRLFTTQVASRSHHLTIPKQISFTQHACQQKTTMLYINLVSLSCNKTKSIVIIMHWCVFKQNTNSFQIIFKCCANTNYHYDKYMKSTYKKCYVDIPYFERLTMTATHVFINLNI